MSVLSLTALLSIMLALPSVGFGGGQKPSGTVYPAQYQGGTVGLKQNHAVKAVVASNAVVFIQHGEYFVVPVQNISEILCSKSIHRRFGAAVLGRVPLVDLDKVEERYVAVTWTENTGTGRTAVFKLGGSQYRDFLDALEQATGKRAVNTSKTPSVVHYEL